MLETLSESYVQQVPAFKRKAKCKACGSIFFKKVPFQVLCGECLANEVEKELHFADLMRDEAEEISWEEAHGAFLDDDGKIVV